MNEEYQEIDLVEIFKALLAKWWLIAIFVLVFAGASYYYTINYVTPIYQAKATLFIGKETGSLSDISLSDLTMDSELLADYKELIKTRLVTEAVIDDLSLNSTRGNMVSNLGVSIISDSRFMYVSYRDPIPERAELIANRLSEILAEKAESIMGIKNVQIVDYAITPNAPISPSKARNMLLAGFVGAVLAAGIVLLMMLAKNTVDKEEDIEKLTGLPVLGSIPKFKGAAR